MENKIIGKGGISATVILHSTKLDDDKNDIVTFELEYPRFIHSEFMTHRVFSRNAASSRAIPVKAMLRQVSDHPAMPIHWGRNQSGMQAAEQLEGVELDRAITQWKESALDAAINAERMMNMGVHKQITNRMLEPFQMMKTVMTTTELDNFFELRNHKDAQPEIEELAKVMLAVYDRSTPAILDAGHAHVPYVGHFDESCCKRGTIFTPDGIELTYVEAMKLSASLCAQVSYRKADQSLEKALDIYQKLVGMKPVHASPFEHQAIVPMEQFDLTSPGVTHLRKDHKLVSGNFVGWIQNRQLLANF